jgi:hypothetical protein
MADVCAIIPSGTSPRMPASCCWTIAVRVQCTVPCAATQLAPTSPKFSPISSGVRPPACFTLYHGEIGLGDISTFGTWTLLAAAAICSLVVWSTPSERDAIAL